VGTTVSIAYGKAAAGGFTLDDTIIQQHYFVTRLQAGADGCIHRNDASVIADGGFVSRADNFSGGVFDAG